MISIPVFFFQKLSKERNTLYIFLNQRIALQFYKFKLMQIKDTPTKKSPPAPPTLKPISKQEDITEKLILELQGFKLDNSPPQNESFEQNQDDFLEQTQMQEEELDEDEKPEEGKRSYKQFIDEAGPQHSISKVLTRLNRKPRKIVLK